MWLNSGPPIRTCDAIAPREIAGQQDRPEDRGRRDRMENGAEKADRAQASRKTFARTVPHSVHRFRDNRPRHQLDGAVEQHEQDDESAENAAHPPRRSGNRRGDGHRRRGFIGRSHIRRVHLSSPLQQAHDLETNETNPIRHKTTKISAYSHEPAGGAGPAKDRLCPCRSQFRSQICLRLNSLLYMERRGTFGYLNW